jgi:hypothetical protein
VDSASVFAALAKATRGQDAEALVRALTNEPG